MQDETTQGGARARAVIEAEELAQRLDERGLVVVDCRFDLSDPAAGFAAYRRTHVPGARYANLDTDLSRRPLPEEGRHPLPSPAVFAARLGEWGISSTSFVVAYDGGPGALAARLWWMLRWVGVARAAVLNGGFARWLALGLPVESPTPHPAPARCSADTVREAWVVSAPEVAGLAERGGLLVDVREAARFSGEREPIDAVAGHVPGASNRPFTANLGADGRLRPPAELRTELTALLAGREPSELVAMCGSGVTACHLLWAMESAGLAPGRLFVGSWSEWIRDPARPTATGR